MKHFNVRVLTCMVVSGLLLVAGAVNAMVFKADIVPAQWDTWDTWCYYDNGTYYLYYLVIENGIGNKGFGVASSADGVHWRDHGWAVRPSEKMVVSLGTGLGSGAVWKDPDFARTRRFICNYSEGRLDETGGKTQNILFAWSTDLIHWEKFGDSKMFRVDERYYERYGRWECIFPLARAAGGYYGVWTATPKGRTGIVAASGRPHEGIGLGFTTDGITWTALPAPSVEPEASEAGAFAEIGAKIYAMFDVIGKTTEMVSYVADRPEGPYTASGKNRLLLGGDAYFARFFPTSKGLLVNHHSTSAGGTYVAPLKRAMVDAEGVLRWKYWEGNETLKGTRVKVSPQPRSATLTLLTDGLNFRQGVVAEGTLDMSGVSDKAPTGVYLEADGRGFGIRVRSGDNVQMGTLDNSGGNWKLRKQVNRSLVLGKSVRFRLLARRGMLEFYLDDNFIECLNLGLPQAMRVRVGLIGDRQGRLARGVKVWRMTLPA